MTRTQARIIAEILISCQIEKSSLGMTNGLTLTIYLFATSSMYGLGVPIKGPIKPTLKTLHAH